MVTVAQLEKQWGAKVVRWCAFAPKNFPGEHEHINCTRCVAVRNHFVAKGSIDTARNVISAKEVTDIGKVVA